MSTMQYPSQAEVEAASFDQLMLWRQRLPKPGDNFLAAHDVEGDFFSMTRRAWYTVREEEERLLDRICERIQAIKTKLDR